MLVELAIEIIVGLGTFSLLRTNRLRSASRCTRAVRAVLLRIRGTRMHVAHYQTNRAIMQICKSMSTDNRESQGERAVTYV